MRPTTATMVSWLGCTVLLLVFLPVMYRIYDSVNTFYPAPPSRSTTNSLAHLGRDDATASPSASHRLEEVRAPYGTPMVFVHGDTLAIGPSDAATATQFNHPRRIVRVRAFWIDQHEVTVGQFVRFLNETMPTDQWRRSWLFSRGEERTGRWPAHIYWDGIQWTASLQHRDLPMTWVSSHGARAFCEFYGLRLPTEVEWEFAALSLDAYNAAGRPTHRPPRTHAVADPPGPRPIRRHSANNPGFGLPDNVSEWVLDRYRPDAWLLLDAADPQPVLRGRYGLMKGGNFLDSRGRTILWQRTYSHASQCRFAFTGFRCIRPVSRDPLPTS
ncbi:MAG: hypothetical protein D6738_03355 [Acidobacteria bacterium]|nr:MAG: hypothetical protein D6738_03355 [Acidobacteriota bacterium]